MLEQVKKMLEYFNKKNNDVSLSYIETHKDLFGDFNTNEVFAKVDKEKEDTVRVLNYQRGKKDAYNEIIDYLKYILNGKEK